MKAVVHGLIALVLFATPAFADGLKGLVQQYESIAGRRDERGFEEQQKYLLDIADLRTPQARKALERCLDKWGSRGWRQAGLILEALVRHAGPKDIEKAIRWVEKKQKNQKDDWLFDELGNALAATRSPTARHYLREEVLQAGTPMIRTQAARALGILRDRDAVPALLRLVQEMKDSLLRARVEALFAVGVIKDKRATSPLIVFLKDEDAPIRDAAAQALGLLGDPQAAKALCKALDDPHPLVVESAALSLALLQSPACIDHLIRRLAALYPADIRTADAVAEALERISGKRLGVDADAWGEWWEAVKDKPFVRDDRPEKDRTVPGLPYYGFRIRSSKIVFVIDISRSMGWPENAKSRLETAKLELVKVLESLPETTSFNIVAYSDRADAWKTELQPASKSKVNSAVAYVKKLRPQNGTNTFDALMRAMKNETADTIFFLSDGSPSTGVADPERILALLGIENRYRRVRIHTVALVIGSPPTAANAVQQDDVRAIQFMKRLAEKNDGMHEVVR